MTHAIPFTQASLCRAIAAARKAGLCVKGIRPDGTLIVVEPEHKTFAQAVEKLEDGRDVVL